MRPFAGGSRDGKDFEFRGNVISHNYSLRIGP
jgi:hypothetical protein